VDKTTGELIYRGLVNQIIAVIYPLLVRQPRLYLVERVE